MRNTNDIPETSDPMDDMLLTDRDTVIVTQAGAAHDTFPAPYGQDDTALAGLGDVRSAKRLAPLGVRPESGEMQMHALMIPKRRGQRGFLPGLGDVKSSAPDRHLPTRVLSRGRNKQSRLPIAMRGQRGFLPGLGEHDAETDDVSGLGAAPHRLKPKMVVHRGVATKAPPAMRARTPAMRGFLPGMGSDTGTGLSFGALALIGAGALYLLLRKRK